MLHGLALAVKQYSEAILTLLYLFACSIETYLSKGPVGIDASTSQTVSSLPA